MKPYLKVSLDRTRELEQHIASLADRRVLVGFPRDTTDRQQNAEITNAELGYIHNFGAPEVNIPAREFMESGLDSQRDKLVNELAAVAESGLDLQAETSAVDRGMHRVGLTAAMAIKARINSNIPPPLADATLADRRRRGSKRTNTLVDTAQMRNAVTYVIRKRKSQQNIAIGPRTP